MAMKRLLDRLKRRPSDILGEDDDTDFASSMVGDDDLPPQVEWAVRRPAVHASAFDAAQGATLLASLWGQDRHATALGSEALLHIGTFFDFVDVPAQQEVIGQDEQGNYMMILLSGRVNVDRVQPWGGRARLADARAGDMLGEMSLLDAGARFSACTTTTACTFAVLTSDAMSRMVRDEPRLALALMGSLSRRLSLRLRRVSARLSALLPRA